MELGLIELYWPRNGGMEGGRRPSAWTWEIRTDATAYLDCNRVIVEESRVGTTEASISKVFGSMSHCQGAEEVGMHSAWVSGLLHRFGRKTGEVDHRQLKRCYFWFCPSLKNGNGIISACVS
jgi:hypothetical protein